MGSYKYILHLFKIFKFSFVNVSDVLKLYQNDETHPKSRNHWQVRDALWCVAQEDGKKDGGVAARHLHLPLLQGLFEETVRGNLALQRMPQDDRRWCVDSLHHRRRHRQKRHPPSPGNQRTGLNLKHRREKIMKIERFLAFFRWSVFVTDFVHEILL